MIGTLQATEIVKIIVGASPDEILSRRMVFFDGLTMKFRTVKLREKIPSCKVCGDNPSIKNVKEFDYDTFCSTNCDKYALIKIPPENNITVEDFHSQYIS